MILQWTASVSPDDLSKIMQLHGTEVNASVELQHGSLEGLCHKLLTDPTRGISESAVDIQQRREKFGSNQLIMKQAQSLASLIWKALKEPMLIILQVAALVSLAVSLWGIFRPNPSEEGKYEWIESVTIIVAVVVIVVVSALNDYAKEKQFRALQDQVRKQYLVNVIRGGTQKQIASDELVVGDICVLKCGDVVPGDALMLSGHDLQVDESSLTGESDHVRKVLHGDIRLLSGTNVMEGSARALVVAVGMFSQSGQIYAMLGTTKTDKKPPQKLTAANSDTTLGTSVVLDKAADYQDQQSVLQQKLTTVAKQIGKVGLAFALATTVVIIIRFCVYRYVTLRKPWDGGDMYEIVNAFITGITILVAAVPEGLPLTVTLTLAASAKKMMRDHNLVRHLFACETMGCATTICSDKTGTLTTNRMTVTQSFIAGEQFDTLKKVPALSNISKEVLDVISQAVAINSSYSSNVNKAPGELLAVQTGDKTECALLGFLSTLGRDYRQIRRDNPEEHFAKVYPFNSYRKSMTTVVRSDHGWRVFCKGAPEVLLEKCRFRLAMSGFYEDFPETERELVLRQVVSQMASTGLRTICLAFKDIPNDLSCSQVDLEKEDDVLSDLAFLAVVGIEDPVRCEVPKAIEQCQSAGVTVRMVTGDSVQTAMSIAIKCGIVKPEEISPSSVMDSEEFNLRIRDSTGQINQNSLDDVWPALRVLARSTPQDKYTLVNGIKNSHASRYREVVAVTGDGTNDAPALKTAHVGFAMGIVGTEVAKEASDIILTDDNFSSIVKACMWGRNIYDNICKFLQFQLTVNISLLVLSLVAAAALGDTSLRPVPMLWINLIMDTFASLALATEPPSENLLKRKPYGRTANIISRIMIRNILAQSAYQLLVLFLLIFGGSKLFFFLGRDLSVEVNMDALIFNAFVMMTLFNLINSRCINNERNIFAGIFRNAVFLLVLSFSITIQVILIEFGGQAFSTNGLNWQEWLLCMLVGIGSLVWYQLIVFIPAKCTVTLPNLKRGANFELEEIPYGKF